MRFVTILDLNLRGGRWADLTSGPRERVRRRPRRAELASFQIADGASHQPVWHPKGTASIKQPESNPLFDGAGADWWGS